MIDDWRTSPVTGKLRAAIGFLEKLTLTPDEVNTSDVTSLQQAGLDARAIVDAIYVCVGFNVIVRIADAFEFTVPPSRVFDRSAKYLLLFGYKLLSGKWFGGVPDDTSDSANEPDLAGVDLLHDPYDRGIRLLKRAALSHSGRLSIELREAALSSTELPGVLGKYVSLIRRRAWDITDADIESLRQAGFEEDQIFETTVCAAMGAGLARLEKGLAVLRQAAHPGRQHASG